MRTFRPAIAADPTLFGRRGLEPVRNEASAHPIADDVKLFASTFAAGFLFVSVLIF